MSLIGLGVDALVRTQLPDGSWPASARLRIPLTDCLEPDAVRSWELGGRIQGSLTVDHRRIFTTASVLSAITRGRARLADSP